MNNLGLGDVIYLPNEPPLDMSPPELMEVRDATRCLKADLFLLQLELGLAPRP